MATPEQKARQLIDAQLEGAGWIVQDRDEMNLGAGLGVAVREYPLAAGPCDYLLFVDRRACGVIEAKPEGVTLSGVADQASGYQDKLPGHLGNWGDPLRFDYEASGSEILFSDRADHEQRSRYLFGFHQPATLLEWLKAGTSLRGRLQGLPPLDVTGLRDCQTEAITALEASLAGGKPRALVQMTMGAGKTFTAATLAYRLLAHADAKRVLFLVDRNNLGRQTLKEFQAYRPPGTGRLFTELYNVQRLGTAGLDRDAKVVISTIQRVFAQLSGQELSEEDEEVSAYEGETRGSPRAVAYSADMPPETFDVVIVDECHRSIYGTWRQVLEYFDAFTIGLTATPSAHTLGYFQKNLVAEYPYERAVIDGVNVPFEVFRIRTEIGERGGRVPAGFTVPRRDRHTRRQRYEELTDDLIYAPSELDRSVIAPNQIRTVLETYRDTLSTELFPGRDEVPKTLIFAKDDHHAEEVVHIAREVFGKGNEFAKKITYNTGNVDPETLIAAFRNSYNPRIAVTVDMIATGTDIKPVEVLVFLRDVKSALYFEQMKGRGVRTVADADLAKVTPDARTKDRFVIIDAVGVTESAKTISAPMERERVVAFDKLLEQVASGRSDPDVVSTLAARLRAHHRHDVLQEVQLFVARGDREVLADIVLPLGVDPAPVVDDAERLALPERRVGQDNVPALGRLGQQGVRRDHRRRVAADPVQVEVHGAQPHHLGHDVVAAEGLAPQPFVDLAVPRRGLGLHVLVGGQQEPTGPTGRVADGLRGLRVDHLDHGLDERPRGEVLARPTLHLAGVPLQQALVDCALYVHVHAHPGLAVDQADQALELGGIVDLALGLEEQRADEVGAFRELGQRVLVVGVERLPGLRPQGLPLELRGDQRGLAEQLGPLVVHLQEQEEADLADVFTVADALVAQHVGVVPDFADERLFVHATRSPRKAAARTPARSASTVETSIQSSGATESEVRTRLAISACSSRGGMGNAKPASCLVYMCWMRLPVFRSPTNRLKIGDWKTRRRNSGSTRLGVRRASRWFRRHRSSEPVRHTLPRKSSLRDWAVRFIISSPPRTKRSSFSAAYRSGSRRVLSGVQAKAPLALRLPGRRSFTPSEL